MNISAANRIYIVGPVASGKSTFARQLSVLRDIPCHSLDDVAHGSEGRRSNARRNMLFARILDKYRWIIEDTGRACFAEGMKQAELIILLAPPLPIRIFRILRRWIRQRRGSEYARYRPNFAMLRHMLRWTWNYQTGADGLKGRIRQYPGKCLVLRRKKDIENALRGMVEIGQ